MTRRMRVLALALAAGALVAAFVIVGLAPSAPAGRAAPAFPREALIGPPVTLHSVFAGTGGRPALVVFWASWCGPCAAEAPALERFARSPAGRARLVGVDWSDPISGARAFIRKYGWTFPNVRDGEGTVGYAYHLTDLPTTFVLDDGGRIRAVLRGPQSERSLQRALAGAERS